MAFSEEKHMRADDAPASLYGADSSVRISDDPAVDRFVAVLLNVTSELWVQKELLASLHLALECNGTITKDDWDKAREGKSREAHFDVEAQNFLAQILAPLRE